MALIDFDKFVASFITEMKECSQMRNFSIPRCIKKALEDKGLEYRDEEIIKAQRRVSAEAKENGYGEPDKFGEYINELSKQFPEVSFAKLSRIAVRVKNWLEKQGQKPAWSEEDEKMKDLIISVLEVKHSKGIFKVGLRAIRTEEIISWLKSLKQRDTWKPSDKQMEVLDSVIDEYNGYPEYGSLVSLKKDLKKLKGE